MKYRYLLLSAGLCLCTHTDIRAAGYVKKGNAVTINVSSPGEGGARMVRLQVMGDRIIRVEATPEEAFAEKQSLIVVPQKTKARFSVSESDGFVTVSTAGVSARVSTVTGRIEFRDAEGRLLLGETENGGKTFRSFVVPEREIGPGMLPDEARHGWTWHTQFESPADEAFYGLGQHQAEELNMKGKNEELFQYNTKVSVPIVLSNRGYGLLWDSYSYCRFGNPDEYRQLQRIFRLYDRDGRPGSLTGTYTDKTGRVVVRSEDSIYFEHAVPEVNPLHRQDLGIYALPKDFNLDGAHVTYEGYIEAPEDCDYHFLLYYAGYMSVYVDNHEAVTERWRTAWNPNAWKFTCQLKAGRRVPIRIEWRPDGGVSYCGLRVATPRTVEEQPKNKKFYAIRQ